MTGDQQPPPRIGKYGLGERLGRGSCGVVYRARDPFIGRDVAIKIAHPGDTARTGATVSEEAGRRAFFAEAHAAGQLAHPHIVSVYDAGIEGPYSYIVMEYVGGKTLQAWGQRGTERLPADRIVDIAFRCCHALDYAHRRGVVHRDVKPSNIMLTPAGTTKLTDFSIALMAAAGAATRPGVVEGTPNYMAPEQVQGVGVGPHTDVYAVGAVMFELLAGRQPFEETAVQKLFRLILHAPPPRLDEVVPDLPKGLADVVAHALAKEPAERYASAVELAADLSRVYDRLRRAERQIAKAANRDLLRGLDFFDAFSDDDIESVLASSTMLQYRQGDVLIREGQIDTSFYILVVGSAAVTKGGSRIETLGKGDCFGEMGLIAETRRSATLTADTDIVLLKIDKSTIELAPVETQLLYYRTFAETLIYRLAVTSARLSAALQRSGGDGA